MYSTVARGTLFCAAADRGAALHQVGAALATGNRALVPAGALDGLPPLPAPLAEWVGTARDPWPEDVAAVLTDAAGAGLIELEREAADRAGAIVPVHAARPDGSYPLEWLVEERSVSTNTAAAGGNASLMAIG